MSRSTGSLPPLMMPESRNDAMLLIADVAALTGVPAPQLRSWESAGILHPRRSPNATRLYGNEDVARVRLIKRSVQNPGRRGSLRRLARAFEAGTLVPALEDYEGLTVPGLGAAPLTDAQYWHGVVDALLDLMIVCDMGGRVISMNAALRALLPGSSGAGVHSQTNRDEPGSALPEQLATLPLHWAALTGTRHRGVPMVLTGADGTPRRTIWDISPLRDDEGKLRGAVGIGRDAPHVDATLPEDWLASALHDLRTPVTTILGRLQLARRAAASPADDARHTVANLDMHMSVAQVSTLDLIRTMETLLDASAIANGALLQHLEAENVDIGQTARRAVDHARKRTSRHSFTLLVPSSPLIVAGDPLRLEQVLDNLLSNAVKYAPDGGPVTVTVEATSSLPSVAMSSLSDADPDTGDKPRWALLRVSDTGLGIPVAAVPHVFDRYWRAPGVVNHIRGSGLGLFTCRAIVAAHGGHVWVERTVVAENHESPGDSWHGTVMAVLLPLAVSPDPVAHEPLAT
jgi:signal transduction histidine kinase